MNQGEPKIFATPYSTGWEESPPNTNKSTATAIDTDQINSIYPLEYIVVKGDVIYQIAKKFPVWCSSFNDGKGHMVGRFERGDQIISANYDFLAPRAGLNSEGKLLIGPDFILPGDKLIIPGYTCPILPTKKIEPETIAEFTLCSKLDGIIGVLQIIKYPGEEDLSVISKLRNFPEGDPEEYTFGTTQPFNPDLDLVANRYLDEDLNPDLREGLLSGDMELCKKVPFQITSSIVTKTTTNPSESIITPISDVEIIVDGSSTTTDDNGDFELIGTFPISDFNNEFPYTRLSGSEYAYTFLEEPEPDLEFEEIPITGSDFGGGVFPPPIYTRSDVDDDDDIPPSKKRRRFPFAWNFGWPEFSFNIKIRRIEWERNRKKFLKEKKEKPDKDPKDPKDKKPKIPKTKIPKLPKYKKPKDPKDKKPKDPKDKKPKDPKDKIPKIPKILCKKNGWCNKEIPLIGLNGLPKFSLGLIELEPFDPKFNKFQRPDFIFPSLELKKLSLPKINFEMAFQLKMNKIISNIKVRLLAAISMLLAKFNICDIPKALLLLAAGIKFKDLGLTCPSDPKEMQRLIKRRNKLTKAVNNLFKFFKTIKITVDTTDKLLTVADALLIAAQIITFIPSTVVTPIPSASSNIVEGAKRQLKKYGVLIPGILSILAIIILLLTKVLQMLALLDNAIETCSQENNIDQNQLIQNELLLATFQQSAQGEKVVTNVNGFEMAVITVDSVEIDGTKRRQAIARNKAGVIMLRGEPSFSANDQILIDELVFYIQQNDLKAD